MPTKIQLRRDPESLWSTNNPVLAEGEIGVTTDTGYLKIGDGSTAWNGLNYFTGYPYSSLDSEWIIQHVATNRIDSDWVLSQTGLKGSQSGDITFTSYSVDEKATFLANSSTGLDTTGGSLFYNTFANTTTLNVTGLMANMAQYETRTITWVIDHSGTPTNPTTYNLDGTNVTTIINWAADALPTLDGAKKNIISLTFIRKATTGTATSDFFILGTHQTFGTA